MSKEQLPKGFGTEGTDFEDKLREKDEPIFHAATLKERALAFYAEMGIEPPEDLLAEDDAGDEWDQMSAGPMASIASVLGKLSQPKNPPTP